jgi:hypothetical protein
MRRDVPMSFLGVLVALPVTLVIAIVLVPVLVSRWFVATLERMAVRAKLRSRWPPGVVGVISYSNSRKWKGLIESELLPQIGQRCVVINRTQDPAWEKNHALECRVQELWCGSLRHNPIVLFVPRRGKIACFPLYHALREAHQGRREELESQLGSIKAAFRVSGEQT